MATYTCQGIILRQYDRGEADQMFHLYSDTHGKISALGRATKKGKSKLNYQLQHFAVAFLMIASGSKTHDHIAGVEIVHNFYRIKASFRNIILASYGLELTDKLTHWLSPDTRIFDLLSWYLSEIDEQELSDAAWRKLRQEFVLTLLSYLGYQPETAIAENDHKLSLFLKEQLNSELNTEKFLSKMIS